MLRSIIICPDKEMAQRLQASLAATGQVSSGRTIEGYPTAVDLVRTLRAHAPDLVFLSFEAVDKAQEVVRFLEAEAAGLQIIAIAQQCDAKLLRETMRAGVREFLADPFEAQALMESITHVQGLLERNPPTHETTNQIFSFLPSKAGVGTSTLALNVSAALSRRPDTRTLLSDFDLNSGMMRFMLKLQNEYSVIDAVENSLRIDENLWPQLVTSMGSLDVLHAGRLNPNLRIESSQIQALVEFVRRNYQAICFDLSGNLERYSLEIMQESKRVLLVCTPEIPSLHLAREKLNFLRKLDLDTRLSVILNRCQKKPLFTKEEVEKLLGLPVVQTFPNDYHGVTRAMTAGTFIEPKLELSKAIEQFARNLFEQREGARVDKHKFLEFFAVGTQQYAPSEK